MLENWKLELKPLVWITIDLFHMLSIWVLTVYHITETMMTLETG